MELGSLLYVNDYGNKYKSIRDKLPYGYFDSKTVSFFPYLFRGHGWRILQKLNRTLEVPTAQFLISVIVSYSKIACRNTKVIRQSEGEWKSLDKIMEYLWRYDQYCLSFNRLMFYLNQPNPSIHDKVRLLDQDETIRRQLYDSPYNRKIDTEPTNNFLAVMKEQFFFAIWRK